MHVNPIFFFCLPIHWSLGGENDQSGKQTYYRPVQGYLINNSFINSELMNLLSIQLKEKNPEL
jgi:hypothetical protein